MPKRQLEIILSPHAGYCFGVKRAMRLIEQGLAERGAPIYTLGEVIHNPQEVERLRARGVRPVESVDEVPSGATLVIRAHGVQPELIAAARSRGVILLDATCPFVQRSQRYVRESPTDVVIIGAREHPEVRGIAGHARGRVRIVKSVEEAKAMEPLERACVIVQTTFGRDEAERIVAALRRRVRDLSVQDTICEATEARRGAAIDLARRVDLMLVVGGRNSSNTNALYRLCLDAGIPARAVESADEIDPAWFCSVSRIGVTTGTSTPDWIIAEVVRRLRAIAESG